MEEDAPWPCSGGSGRFHEGLRGNGSCTRLDPSGVGGPEDQIQDTGMGSFLIFEVTNPSPSVSGAPPLLAVLAFLILLTILVVNLCADVLSRWLDPRLGWGRRRA